ncbi:MAG: SRPBCC family protein [Saprospiraceae bacterium]|nr:SRPBCC family protein [Saprospiraceae bacterium]
MMSFIILLSTFVGVDTLAEPTNKHFWHTLETEVDPTNIWQVWTTVDLWHEWDTGLKSATMEGAFELGSTGKLISLEGRRSKFKIVDYEANQSYTFRTPLLFSNLYVKRYLKTVNGKTTITHEVWFKGLTAGIFANKFGPKFRELLPDVMREVVKKAQTL